MGARLPRKIPVAVNGSETSLKAAEYASSLAERLKSRFGSLHAILILPGALAATLQVIRNDLSSRGKTILGRMSELVTSRGATVEGVMAETDRSVVQALWTSLNEPTSISSYSAPKDVGDSRLMLGSVAAGVVSSAHCPVLAVR